MIVFWDLSQTLSGSGLASDCPFCRLCIVGMVRPFGASPCQVCRKAPPRVSWRFIVSFLSPVIYGLLVTPIFPSSSFPRRQASKCPENLRAGFLHFLKIPECVPLVAPAWMPSVYFPRMYHDAPGVVLDYPGITVPVSLRMCYQSLRIFFYFLHFPPSSVPPGVIAGFSQNNPLFRIE